MRDAIKALALTPDDVDAQRTLLSLVVDGSGKLPRDAQREWEEAEFSVDVHALRLGVAGMASWFVGIPLAMWVGVRSWTAVLVMSAIVLATMGYGALVMRWRTRKTVHMMTLNVALATALALTSCWLGPFVLVPMAVCAVALVFGGRCKASERPWIMLIWSIAILAPFAVELLHVFPPAYTFERGGIMLHPRAFDLPERPTLFALAYTSVTFMLLPMLLIGQLRDRQRNADRRLFVQAWHLRQLFPAATAASDETPRRP
jgi:serine/threonine-protein kinase